MAEILKVVLLLPWHLTRSLPGLARVLGLTIEMGDDGPQIWAPCEHRFVANIFFYQSQVTLCE
jgi:hypothetical protein